MLLSEKIALLLIMRPAKHGGNLSMERRREISWSGTIPIFRSLLSRLSLLPILGDQRPREIILG